MATSRRQASEKYWFQFLIGRLQTPLTAFSPAAPVAVSIPHRQATNGTDIPVNTVTEPGFNSSQVGYKLTATSNALCCPTSFNSSQVGYKLYCGQLGQKSWYLFQFLIGRLQTEIQRCLVLLAYPVSIPHRQATNPLVWPLPNVWLGGFNSSQVGYKPQISASFRVRISMFQFLIGRLQTELFVRLANYQAEFQFLIGRLQTRDRFAIFFVRNDGFNSSQVGYKQDEPFKVTFHPERCFNSSQVGYKPGPGNRPRKRWTGWFQFLIGRLQTQWPLPKKKTEKPCFNSSQVGYKLPGQAWRCYLV